MWTDLGNSKTLLLRLITMGRVLNHFSTVEYHTMV